MPTPRAYDKLWNEYQALRRAVARYLSAPPHLREDDELWELAGDYEPSEIERQTGDDAHA